MDMGSGYIYPFVFFAMTDTFARMVKEDLGIDLYNTTDLAMICKNMMALGIFIYASDDSITSYYDGGNSTSTVMMSDFTSSVSKYEKDIATMIRLSK